MIDPGLLANGFESNTWVINKQVEGLTQADTLIQPPFRGNCLNWILGHIIGDREYALALLDEPPLWSEAEKARYASGSAPITGNGTGSGVLTLDRLLDDLDTSTMRIAGRLRRLTMADMEKLVGERTVGQRLFSLYWHESYHVGQTELFRQLAGKEDAVF
ncbi:MAG: DinB family protein [Anaerolineae bacterium]|nr:DinB family protein [Anaerolineae bacterium]